MARRIVYRGVNPGETRRIQTGVADWDSYLFVTDKVEHARNYGRQVLALELSPDARILREGTREFRKIEGKARPESMLAWASRIARAALALGWDGVYFTRQGDIGTAIFNRDIVLNSEVVEERPTLKLPNPSLWQRIPADLDASIRAYRTHTDDVDEFYYHVTTATNARGVLSGGLRPHGRSTMDDGFYRSYSAGKVFVTELGGVRFWMSRVEDHLESQGRWSPTSKLVILRALKSDIGDVEHDEFGSRDARAAAYQATRDLGRVERRKRTN